MIELLWMSNARAVQGAPCFGRDGLVGNISASDPHHPFPEHPEARRFHTAQVSLPPPDSLLLQLRDPVFHHGDGDIGLTGFVANDEALAVGRHVEATKERAINTSFEQWIHGANGKVGAVGSYFGSHDFVV